MEDQKTPTFATCSFVAQLTGVSAQCVRNYVKAGLITPSAQVVTFGEGRGPMPVFGGDAFNEAVEKIRSMARLEKNNPQIFGSGTVADLAAQLDPSIKFE